jgi:hypothetical protein
MGALPILNDAAIRAAPAAVPRLTATRRALRLMWECPIRVRVDVDAYWARPNSGVSTDHRLPDNISDGVGYEYNFWLRLSFY